MEFYGAGVKQIILWSFYVRMLPTAIEDVTQFLIIVNSWQRNTATVEWWLLLKLIKVFCTLKKIEELHLFFENNFWDIQEVF